MSKRGTTLVYPGQSMRTLFGTHYLINGDDLASTTTLLSQMKQPLHTLCNVVSLGQATNYTHAVLLLVHIICKWDKTIYCTRSTSYNIGGTQLDKTQDMCKSRT